MQGRLRGAGHGHADHIKDDAHENKNGKHRKGHDVSRSVQHSGGGKGKNHGDQKTQDRDIHDPFFVDFVFHVTQINSHLPVIRPEDLTGQPAM
jgi:hypothetical protein